MLHCASLVGNTQIVMMLLQYGADVMALTDVRTRTTHLKRRQLNVFVHALS